MGNNMKGQMKGMMMQMMSMMGNMGGYNKGGYGKGCGGMCGGPGGKGPDTSHYFDPEQFLRNNDVEEKAATSFRNLDTWSQQQIIKAGSLKSGRANTDPTAILISRIAKVSRGEPLTMVMNNPGDWVCKGCGALQFARNDRCRDCLAERPIPEGLKDLPHRDVEEFLNSNKIQEHAKDSFRNLATTTQQLIMAAGTLGFARDPTAVLISRMSKAKRGTLEPESKKPGDWECCGDLQFARNLVCRHCGKEKPGTERPAIQQW